METIAGSDGPGCWIVPDNGYDESFLVGSRHSYLRLARLLIDIASCESTGDEHFASELIGGTSVLTTNRIKEGFEEHSPVWVVTGLVTDTDSEAGEIASKLAAHET